MENIAGRCTWCGTDPLYVAYHDDEWGMPLRDPRALWECLMLEGFQAGLSWITILRRREGFRDAFAGFDPAVIATWGEDEVTRLISTAHARAQEPATPAERLRRLRTLTVVELLYATGLRVSELVALPASAARSVLRRCANAASDSFAPFVAICVASTARVYASRAVTDAMVESTSSPFMRACSASTPSSVCAAAVAASRACASDRKSTV